MSGRNRRLFLRGVYVLLIVISGVRLLAQTPTAGMPPPVNSKADESPSPRLLANSNVKLGVGDLIEVGPTDLVFTNPQQKLTEDYITGRFG